MSELIVRDRRDGFLWINNRIIDNYAAKIGGTAMLVYMWMSRYASNETSTCWPGQEFLAEKCGVGERQIKRAIKALVEHKLISVERKQIHEGTHPQNVYTLLEAPKLGDKNVPSVKESGDISVPESGDTTAPLLRLIELDLKPCSLNASESSSEYLKITEKEKHKLFKESIFKCYRYLNNGEDPAWDGSDAKQLSSLIKAKPSLTPQRFHQWLGNYAESQNINKPDRPRKFLPNICSYADGPLNKFGKPPDENDAKRASA